MNIILLDSKGQQKGAKPVKKPTRMVVKVQQSLKTNHAKKRVLVYNQDRSAMLEMDITPDLQELLGEDTKSYWFATLMPDGQLHLNRRTGWRKW